jgi:hypothetical protein
MSCTTFSSHPFKLSVPPELGTKCSSLSFRSCLGHNTRQNAILPTRGELEDPRVVGEWMKANFYDTIFKILADNDQSIDVDYDLVYICCGITIGPEKACNNLNWKKL